jgi:hypothetical protein
VLLDWSGAVIGPPAVDLVRLLTERVNGDDRDALLSEQVSTYAVELAIGEATVMIEDLWDALSNGLALLIQGAVAWAARDENREPRKRDGRASREPAPQCVRLGIERADDPGRSNLRALARRGIRSLLTERDRVGVIDRQASATR